jgi:hypothetical protein
MPPIEIPGLKEEIEKGEFSSWSDDDLIQFMYEPGGSLPNLQHPTLHDLLPFTNSNGGMSRPSNSQQNMKATPTGETCPIGELPRIVGHRTKKPNKTAKARSFNSFGATETHRISVIDLEPHDRATLQVMAKRYRVKSLIHFLEGCLSAEEQRTFQGSQVLFRVYED